MEDFLTLKGGEVDVSGAPEMIAVLPLGHVVSQKGEFNVDEESFRAMKDAIAQRGVDLVIDYEHQTLGEGPAPAAGWVKALVLKDGQICAQVEWTPAAAQYLKNREYRYLSPVITVRKTDGKATGLHSIALTNTPAIEGMTPIVNSQKYEGGAKMDLKKLAQLFGLPEDTAEEDILKAVQACMEENKALKESQGEAPPAEEKKEDTGAAGKEDTVANKAVCELLGLKAGAAADTVAAKIMELKGGTIDGINLVEKVRQLEQSAAESKADVAVTLALKSGKITPAQKGWARDYALDDPKGFAAFLEKAPQVVPLGEIAAEEEKALKGDALDAETLMVCKQMGISEEDIRKYGKR
ncbi:MAG: phage protease [Oscillospiraceae bacterium]|nr:phage protease [Oscillospiraceae bacterium]